MSKLRIVTELSATGQFTELFNNGLLPYKAMMYRDIYYDVDALEKQGIEKMVAKQQIADKYNVTIQTIYNAIAWMKK